jgi:hypothetical protein
VCIRITFKIDSLTQYVVYNVQNVNGLYEDTMYSLSSSGILARYLFSH